MTQTQKFSDGYTPILTIDKNAKVQMNFGSLKLRMGEKHQLASNLESAYLLMTGKVLFNYDNQTIQSERSSYFDQEPKVLHCSTEVKGNIQALTDCEILVMQTPNTQEFASVYFDKSNLLELDHRGKGLLEDASYRMVRTVFDKRNRPASNLVVGEIISFQGGWSSCPPHFHAQPEVYHYRFSEPKGFAMAENGDALLRIRHNDTYVISDGQTHAHCTAPGYALYTLWFIRHLPNNPYFVPEFCSEHEWTRHASANLRAYKMRNI